eukprot:15327681-Ditylum_brightwellii.AAC.1
MDYVVEFQMEDKDGLDAVSTTAENVEPANEVLTAVSLNCEISAQDTLLKLFYRTTTNKSCISF